MEYPKALILNGDLDNSPKEDNNLRAFLDKYFISRWYLYVIFMIIFAAFSYYYLNTIQPEYEIKSRLLIREGDRDNGSTEDWLKRSLNYSAVSENVSNEIHTLNSFSLMNKVVADLQLDVNYYWKNYFSRLDGYTDFPIQVDTFSLNPSGSKSADFRIIPIDEHKFQFFQDSLIGVYKFGELFNNKYGVFRLQKNGAVPLMSDSTMHVQFLHANAVTERYLEKLEVVFTDEQSTMLELILSDVIPQRGIDIMTQLIGEYKKLTIQEKNEIISNTLKFIDDRLEDISRDLNSIEGSLERFKVRNEITSESTSDLQIMLQNVSELDDERKDIDVQLSILGTMKRNLDTSADKFGLIPTNLTTGNSQINELINPYNNLVLERRQLLNSAKPSNPVVQTTTKKLVSLRSSIISAIDNLSSDLELKLNSINSQFSKSSQRLRSVPQKERRQLDKERNQSIKEKLYVYLLQKREETALALISTSSNSRLIDSPRSSVGASVPKKKIIYFGGLLGGLALPFLLIFIPDLFKDSIETEDDIKNIIPDGTIIGTINQHKGKEKKVVLRQNNALVSERFRSLRVNLQFYNDRKQHSILVTSSTNIEGKTFIATNLATSFALAKKKTIIIDFDLRNPKVDNYLEESVETGLSNYLEGALDVSEIIHVSKSEPSLHFITSGSISSNPAELITAPKLSELFSYLKSRYDIIIVDTPPIGIVSDAILLKSHITDSLFVVRSGITKKAMVENAREIFDQDKLVNPSVILNGIKRSKAYSFKN